MESNRTQFQFNDRWVIRPYLFSLSYPLIVIALTATAHPWGSILLALLLALVILALALSIPFIAWRLFRNGFVKKGFSYLGLLVFIVVLLCLSRWDIRGGNIVRFYWIRPSLQAKVDALSGKDSEKLLIFTTDGFLSTAYGFAYDGSDELELPAGKQTDAWMKRAKGTELEVGCFDSFHISGHYYGWSVSGGC